MRLRKRMDKGARVPPHRTLAVAMACMSVVGAVRASEPSPGVAEVIRGGKPLWLASSKNPAQYVGATQESVPVALGRDSSPLKKLAAQVLGTRYPCAALALTLFDPPNGLETRWELVVDGVPTPKTAALIAANADQREIYESMPALGSLPFDPTRAMRLSMRIDTHATEPEISVSTIACKVIESGGFDLQVFEPSIRFVWNTYGAKLTGLYEVSATTAATASTTMGGK
jgi:hypothetical protein